MFIVNYKAVSWWYFLGTVALLTVGVAGYPEAFLLAIGVSLAHLVHFVVRERSLTTFSVQVRIGVLAVLLASLPEPMRWMFWIPLVGIWVQVFFGYCLLARLISLLPWNLKEPYSFSLLRRTLISPPVPGNALQVPAQAK